MAFGNSILGLGAGGEVPSFNTVIWTGDGTTGRQINGVGFEPSLTWVKGRSLSAYNHILVDSVRGANLNLATNNTSGNSGTNYYQSFDSDGFTVDSNIRINGSGETYVAWNWRAGGAAVSNTAGTITSQVSANTEAGFSIVSYTGAANGTVGHGLGTTPSVVIAKGTSGGAWGIYHIALGTNKFIQINSTNAATTESNFWGSAGVTNSSVFGLSTDPYASNVFGQMIAYCFAEVAGFSKFGSYSGIDDTDVKVYTDSNGDGTGTGAFQPRFVMIKLYNNTGGGWAMFDALRDGGNPTYNLLFANLSNAESTYSNIYGVQFDSDGFTVKGHTGGNDQINETGGSYIFMAFA
jgi:hypothetical protein